MKKKSSSKYEQLSLGDLLNGILVYMDDIKFSEQQLFSFFYDISLEEPELSRRLQFKVEQGYLHSEPLHRILSFREMGKLVEISPPNPVNQFYRPRKSQIPSLKNDLKSIQILPAYEDILKELAGKFEASLH